MADGKIIAFAVAALVIGAAVGVGIGFVAFKEKSSDETYYFYIDFGDNDTKTGWYSAKAANADDALAKAVDGKEGIKLSYSGGYPVLDEAHTYWYQEWYLWDTYTKEAADNSLDLSGGKPVGWLDVNVHVDAEKKLFALAGNVFFLSPYDNSTWAHSDVTTTQLWKTASGSPFATA